MKRFAFVVLLAQLAIGCATARVTLPELPPPDAPIETRASAFRQFSPVGQWKTQHYQNGMYVGSSLDSLVLRGGWTVSDPADLVPLVEKDAPLVKYSEEYTSKTKLGSTFGLASLGLTLGAGGFGGLGLLMVGVGTETVALIGVGSLLLGVGMFLLIVPAVITAWIFNSMAQSAKENAFSSYPESLRQRLRLRPEDVY